MQMAVCLQQGELALAATCRPYAGTGEMLIRIRRLGIRLSYLSWRPALSRDCVAPEADVTRAIVEV